MSAGVIWLPGKFKGKKVFVETANGEMLKQRGKVRMKYSQSTSAKIYSAIASNITFKRKHCDSPVSKSSTEPKVQPKKRKRALSQREKRLQNSFTTLPRVLCLQARARATSHCTVASPDWYMLYPGHCRSMYPGWFMTGKV
eukprot:689212_1